MSKKRKEVGSMVVANLADGTAEIFTPENFKKLDAAQVLKTGGTLTDVDVTGDKKPHKAKH